MKLLALLLPATLASAFAKRACTPGTYQCSPKPTWGWSVCDTQGAWVRAGNCGPAEYCTMNPFNGSPYCIPSPPSEECADGRFKCVDEGDEQWNIIECEGGEWVERVRCEEGTKCYYGAVAGYPYCSATSPY